MRTQAGLLSAVQQHVADNPERRRKRRASIRSSTTWLQPFHLGVNRGAKRDFLRQPAPPALFPLISPCFELSEPRGEITQRPPLPTRRGFGREITPLSRTSNDATCAFPELC